jgi:hypothetical protein
MMTMMDVYAVCPDRAAACSEWAGFLDTVLSVRKAGPPASPEQVASVTRYPFKALANVLGGAVFIRDLRRDPLDALMGIVVHAAQLMGEDRDTAAARIAEREVDQTLTEAITELRAYARRRLN